MATVWFISATFLIRHTTHATKYLSPLTCMSRREGGRDEVTPRISQPSTAIKSTTKQHLSIKCRKLKLKNSNHHLSGAVMLQFRMLFSGCLEWIVVQCTSSSMAFHGTSKDDATLSRCQLNSIRKYKRNKNPTDGRTDKKAF